MENPTWSITILSLILSITTLSISIPRAHSTDLSITPHPPICHGLAKSAKIQFYVQDRLTDPNQTVYEVAESSITPTSPSNFGVVRVADDKMTAGPDYNSQEVGRAQGLVTTADLTVLALAMDINFYFTTGVYNGSTISILGRNAVFAQQFRELSISGGTGMFRCARGYAIASTYSTDPTTLNSVFLYDLYVTYYDR